jgi:four helix bundle protein
MYRNIDELEVYIKARQWRREISALSKTLPIEEKYRVKDQILRSSRSITANICEGHGRFHYQENIQFCRMARGSMTETWDHLTVIHDESWISQKEFDAHVLMYQHLLKLVNGYIAYLKRQKKNDR